MSRSVADRIKQRRLPGIDAPRVEDDGLRMYLEGVKEHLRMYEGDSNAPKERFVTIDELEAAGLIKSTIRNKFATIDDVNAVIGPALRHRILLNFEGEAQGVSTEDLIREVVEATRVTPA